MLEVAQVQITLGDRRFLYDFSLNAGARLAVVGASGSGKSTLINLLGGFLLPERGDMRWFGESLNSLSPADRPVTTLFQKDNLFDHLSVAQNVTLGLPADQRQSKSAPARVDAALQDVGLAGLAHRLPAQLSGGEQQRVALARCLLRHKPLLLLDEPYSALDEGTRDAMLGLTDEVALKNQLTVILVTHRRDDAETLNAPVASMLEDCLRITTSDRQQDRYPLSHD